MGRIEKISFRPSVSKEQLTELAERRGLSSLSDLLNEALADYTGRHLDPHREFYRVFEQVETLQEMLRKEVSIEKRADLGDMLQLVTGVALKLRSLPNFSDAYLRDFGKGK
jgi:hypothetical protein